jgi:2-polyprenyl-6-methoxyphenol hydroxylase-like FAD-dependent oxidoreductase
MPDNQFDLNNAMSRHSQAVLDLIAELGGEVEVTVEPDPVDMTAMRIQDGDILVGADGGRSLVRHVAVQVVLTTEHGSIWAHHDDHYNVIRHD